MVMIPPNATLTLLDNEEELPKPAENQPPKAETEDPSAFDPLFLQMLQAAGTDPELLDDNYRSIVNGFDYSNAEDGSILVTSGTSKFRVYQQDTDQDGTPDSNRVAIVRSGPVDGEENIKAIIEGTQLYKASTGSDTAFIAATSDRSHMIMEKVAELSGLEAKNPLDKKLDDVDPELAAKVEELYEAYAQEHGIEVHKSWDFESPNVWGPYREEFKVTETGEVMLGDKAVTLQAAEAPEAGDTNVKFHALGEDGTVLKDMDGAPITFILDNESVIEMASEIENPESPLKEVAETVESNIQAAAEAPEQAPEQDPANNGVTSTVSTHSVQI